MIKQYRPNLYVLVSHDYQGCNLDAKHLRNLSYQVLMSLAE